VAGGGDDGRRGDGGHDDWAVVTTAACNPRQVHAQTKKIVEMLPTARYAVAREHRPCSVPRRSTNINGLFGVAFQFRHINSPTPRGHAFTTCFFHATH